MNPDIILPILIPSLFAMVASFIGYLLLRRTGKESNDTSAFTAVTDQLFRLNETLASKLASLEKKVSELESEAAKRRLEVEVLEEKLDSAEDEIRDLMVVNGALGRYLGKLVRLWPVTVTVPEPDEPVTWD